MSEPQHVTVSTQGPREPERSPLEAVPTCIGWHHVALCVGALLLVLLCGIGLVRTWNTCIGLDYVSGVWATLASDLRDGLFYRPLIGSNGYGATRYFPLHFTLHAGLMALTGDPVGSG